MKSKTLSGLALSFVLLMGFTASTVATTGCSKSQVAALTNTLGNACASVAVLEGNAPLAQTIKTDTAAAVAAINGWQKGSAVQMAIETLNILQADLSLIPMTSEYTALITLALGTISALLALLPPSTTAAMRAPNPAVRSVQLANPPKTAAEFKKEWNGICAANPGLVKAKI